MYKIDIIATWSLSTKEVCYIRPILLKLTLLNLIKLGIWESGSIIKDIVKEPYSSDAHMPK